MVYVEMVNRHGSGVGMRVFDVMDIDIDVDIWRQDGKML